MRDHLTMLPSPSVGRLPHLKTTAVYAFYWLAIMTACTVWPGGSTAISQEPAGSAKKTADPDTDAAQPQPRHAVEDAPSSQRLQKTVQADTPPVPQSHQSPQHIELIRRYCVDCHQESESQGDRRFDNLSPQILRDSHLVEYQEIVDQINLGRMPPQDAEPMTTGDRRLLVSSMSQMIGRYSEKLSGSGTRTPLRRLNAREYRNTIRDLFGLNMLMFDPTVKFPRDQTDAGLDNHAESLVTSGHLLQAYLNAAEQVVAKAAGPQQKPDLQTWSFTDHFDQQPEIDQVHRKTNGFTHLTLYDVIHADKHEGAYAPIHQFAQGVPVDGYYEIRFEAEAMNRHHPYDPGFLGMDPSEPLRLGIVAGNQEAGTLHLPQPIEPLLAEQTLEDEKRWYKAVVWLDAGFTPRFTFPNGLMDARNLWSRLIRKYPDQFPPGSNQGIVAARYNAIHLGKLPHIRIYEVEIQGPLLDSWPTASQRAIFGDEGIMAMGVAKDQTHGKNPPNGPSMDYVKQIATLASRAYRRPAEPEEKQHLVRFFNRQVEIGKPQHAAFLDTVKMILCSPNFLYLDTSTVEQEGDTFLSAHALASRLSYFLWSSMPDSELIATATDGTLLEPEILRAQADRMLKDTRSKAFLGGFLDSWLGLRDLGATPPDRNRFNRFYHKDLEAAMRRETELFVSHLLSDNLPTSLFLDSDFTFVNAPLAHHYGLQPPKGFEFEKVTLQSPDRGGLLGQASILTLTANGIDTSPVVRGVWILNHLLGMPPAAPPPEVEPLDPDVRGATTIREQLEKHRSNPACYDCHRQIDPLGFALENYDPIGGLRTKYPTGKVIDTSGQLSSGATFDGVADLKKELLAQKDFFDLALTGKLLSYAIGRRTGTLDRRHLESILAATGQQRGFRDLVIETIASEAFRQP